MTNTPLITIGILNRDGLDRLKKTIPSILKQSYVNKEVLVIDNGSTDNSIEFLSSFQQIKIIKNKENLGASKARNILVKNASGEYILMIDNDIEFFDENFLKKILKDYLKLDNPAFLSPLIIDHETNHLNPLALYFNKLQPKKIRPEEIYAKGCFQMPGFQGCIFFFKKDVFFKLGGFDDIYPFNIDDYDMSARAYIFGYKNYVTTNLLAIHHGIDTRNNADSYAWKHKTYLAGFGRTIWKNYTLKNALIWWPISSAWIFYKSLRSSVRYKSTKPVIAYFRSFGSFVKDLPSTLRLRKEIQNKRSEKTDNFLKLGKIKLNK